MRLIDADAFKSKLKKQDARTFAIEEINLLIDFAPTIDAVPVVRCGDCLFCQMELCEGADEPWCDIHNATVGTEMFCSWGIRKDNG